MVHVYYSSTRVLEYRIKILLSHRVMSGAHTFFELSSCYISFVARRARLSPAWVAFGRTMEEARADASAVELATAQNAGEPSSHNSESLLAKTTAPMAAVGLKPDDAAAPPPSRLERWLREHDYEVVDLAKFAAIHEGLGLGLYLATFAGCYALQPSRRIAASGLAQRIASTPGARRIASSTWAQAAEQQFAKAGDALARRRASLQEQQQQQQQHHGPDGGRSRWRTRVSQSARTFTAWLISPRAVLAMVRSLGSCPLLSQHFERLFFPVQAPVVP